jgi:hypothetical protein
MIGDASTTVETSHLHPRVVTKGNIFLARIKIAILE